ncbi:RICIN domain-containing protein [Paenibacillus cellulositrophicus]|uniref:RICIN domain-containing protein n=1 Tax=Paenibacillus cellulositrophicus TaxID=562959 RepID=UPI003F82073C
MSKLVKLYLVLIVLIFLTSVLSVPANADTEVSDDTASGAYNPAANYKIVNRGSGKVLDISDGSTAKGGDVIQWTDSSSASQTWGIADAGAGYYKIINQNSRLLLDVSQASAADGANVIQWEENGGYNQHWSIVPLADGYVKIINRNSGKALDVSNGSTADGGAVIQWTDHGGWNQQWSIVLDDNKEWAATANVFRLNGQSTANNVKISWPQIAGAEYYEVYRGEQLINRVTGDITDEYGLAVGQEYVYTVKAYRGAEQIGIAQTNVARTFSYEPSSIAKRKDNYTGADSLDAGNTYGIKAGNTWYHYFYQAAKDDATGVVTTSIYEQTSTDGRTYGNDRLLGSFEDMRVESASYTRHPVTGKVVFTAHEESSNGYARAAVFIASVTPGRNDFAATFRGRPFEKESRDMSLFVDEDHAAYLIFATRNNSDIAIVKLDENWGQPEKVVNTVFVDKHKESPTILKHEGRYYFFGSTANGWYPSQAEYASAESLGGEWTPLRPIGNGATFATQANGAWGISGSNGRTSFVLNGYHWGEQYAENFKDPMGTYSRLFPTVFSNGVATADWFQKLDVDPVYGLVPVQSGQYLSLGKKATDSQGLDAAAVTDGADLATAPLVHHSALDYKIVIDLEQSAQLSEINFTTRVVGGSDAVYRYKLEGSADGQHWTQLVDGSENGVVGYVANPISDSGHYRYVRLTVNNIINVHNGQNALWADGIIELAVFGTP